MCVTSCLDITRAVNPPRATFLDFPLGHTTGKPNEPELQREIIVRALEGLVTMREPGSVELLPFKWTEDEQWKRSGAGGVDRRLPRLDTPQYDSEEDRRLAEDRIAPSDGCHICASFSGRRQ